MAIPKHISPFNVIIYNINRKVFEPYNIMPYLIQTYISSKKDLKDFEDFKEFVKKESMYQWWSRCEYEIILQDWPSQTIVEKWDVYQQILINLDLITKILIQNLGVNENMCNE